MPSNMLLGVCCGLALGVASPSFAATDRLVAQALALHADTKDGEAYALLKPFAASRAGDPDFDYSFGIIAADAGHVGEAIVALQRVLAAQPQNGQARAEIARVYAMAGDIDTARAQFDTLVQDPTVPDPVRQRFNALVRRYDRTIAGGGIAVSGFGEIESGFDSNINSATGLTSLTLPVFAFLGPAALGGAATRIDAGFAQAQGGVSINAGLDRSTKAYLSVLGVYRDAFKGRNFDQVGLTGTAGIAHTLQNGDAVSLSGQVQQFWLAHSAFRTAYSGIAQYTLKLASDRALAFGVQYSRLDYQRDELRDADRYSGSVTYTGRTVYAGIGAGREQTRRDSARYLSNSFAQASFGVERPISLKVAVIGSAGVEYRDYVNADPLFLRGRNDTQLDASVGLRFLVAPNVTLRPRATYTANLSNLALYDYRRTTASVALRVDF